MRRAMATWRSSTWRSTILASVRDGVAELRFNRPQHLNALNSQLFGEAIDCLAAWNRDESVAVVVLTGGDTDYTELLTEDDISTLERKAFIGLCKQDGTIDRIEQMLNTGKPLRN